MRVNCLNCGHKFDLGDAYDDYEGLVKCSTCATLLDIKTEDGSIKAVRFGMVPNSVQQAAQAPSPQIISGRNAA